jgi:uncharacterized spore protein YtfJ
MQPSEFLPQFAESFTAKRVYSEPYSQDGVTVIAAAAVRGGGGMGQGESDREGGGGMGLSARPVGAYVIRDGRVVWKPAFDFTRIVLRGQLIGFAALLVLGLLLARRARA